MVIYILKVTTGEKNGKKWKRVDYLTNNDGRVGKASSFVPVDEEIENPSSDYLDEVFSKLPSYNVQFDNRGNVVSLE